MESGRTIPHDVLKRYRLGVDDYINKPFIAEEQYAQETHTIRILLIQVISFISDETPFSQSNY
jgi:CheY-like chemotaxis protein